jgi:putative nucleotidyltransferase with HDIG domain
MQKTTTERHLTQEIPVPMPAHPPKILVLEDEKAIQTLVAAMLKIRGYACDVAGRLADARALIGRTRYDLVLVDVDLPDGSGLALTEDADENAPLIVVMTGSNDIQTAIRSIRKGAIDFIAKPFTAEDFLYRIDAAIAEWRTRRSLQYHARTLETLVQMKSDELSRTSHQIDAVYDTTVAALHAALNLKDNETAGHCTRVSQNCMTMGAMLTLSDFECKNLKWGAYLHDIGKIGIPEHILLKEGALEMEERRTMENHPLMGYTMIRNIEFLQFATDVVLSHHERFDGTGYPHGLKDYQIPLNARIFAIMDTLDAMTSDRPYRAALPASTAVTELREKSGSQFDPEIVEAFTAVPVSTWHVQGRILTHV